MNDRALLEAAAKAYWGDEIDDVCSVRWLEDDQAIGFTHGDNQDHNGDDLEFLWNPLTNDGDALRLAVKLGIRHGNDGSIAGVDWWGPDGITMESDSELCGPDPYAATRRAIVRAAAAMTNP